MGGSSEGAARLLRMKENVLLSVLFVIGLCFFFVGVREAQHHSHVVRFYVAGQLRGEMVVTNPVYVHYVGDESGRAVRVTNSYWRVWRIFR